MPIGVLLEISGCTREQYVAVARDVGLLGPEARTPPGMIFHTGEEMPGGWRVFDAWESAEAYETFARGWVAPACRRHGVPAFTPEVFPIDNLQLAEDRGAAQTGRIRPVTLEP